MLFIVLGVVNVDLDYLQFNNFNVAGRLNWCDNRFPLMFKVKGTSYNQNTSYVSFPRPVREPKLDGEEEALQNNYKGYNI